MSCSLKDGLVDTTLLSGSFRRDLIRTSQGQDESGSGLWRRLVDTSPTLTLTDCGRKEKIKLIIIIIISMVT